METWMKARVAASVMFDSSSPSAMSMGSSTAISPPSCITPIALRIMFIFLNHATVGSNTMWRVEAARWCKLR